MGTQKLEWRAKVADSFVGIAQVYTRQYVKTIAAQLRVRFFEVVCRDRTST